MKTALGLMTIFCLWMPSLPLFMDEKVTSYRVPDGSIEIDGKPDSIWFPYMPNSVISIEVNDCSQIVLYGDDESLQKPPCEIVSPIPSGYLLVQSVYDREFVYFFVTIRNTPHRWETITIDDENPMENEMFGIYLDPHLWDTVQYKYALSDDANGKWPGTSRQSLVVFAPVRTPEPSLFLYDRQVNNEFKQRDWDTFQSHFPGFQYAKATHRYTRYVAMEFRIPRFEKALSSDSLAGKGVYFTAGYNDPNGGSFLWYQWSKHYKQVDCIEGKNIGPCGNHDTTHFSPEYSREGWGQLYFHEEEMRVDSSLSMPWQLDISRSHPAVISVEKPIKTKVIKTGSKIHFPNFQSSQLKIFNQKGRVLGELTVQNHQVDLNALKLDPGYYFGSIGDHGFSFIYGLHSQKIFIQE